MKRHTHRKAKCVNHNMFLAPLDLLVAVDPTVGVNMVGGLDASGINDAEAGCLLPPHQFSDHPMERVHQFLGHAFQLPLIEVVEDGVVGREVLGQHTPLAACLQYIHDGIHDVSKGVFSLSVLWVKNIFGNLPLFISKVGRILVYNFVMI